MLLKNSTRFSTACLLSLLVWGVLTINITPTIALTSPKPIQLAANNSVDKLPKPIQKAVLKDASKLSGVAIANLRITQATPKTFSNLCFFNFREVCTEEYNPVSGWVVVVKVDEQSWTYHVNKSGSQVVLDPQIRVKFLLPSGDS